MAVNHENYHYLFQVDFGYDPMVLEVINTFQQSKEVHITKRHGFPNKQSYSLIQGYQNAMKKNPETVGLIEDDVFVANDYFLWHEKNLPGHFASIATRNHNFTPEKNEEIAATYVKSEYQSLGVCFHRDSLQSILNEVTASFFAHPVHFIKKRFPNSHIGHFFAEQDGLIRRIIHEKQHKVIYPHVPRAFHAGFYGKSRGEKPSGSLEERIKKVKFTAFDPQIMTGDSRPEMLVNPIY